MNQNHQQINTWQPFMVCSKRQVFKFTKNRYHYYCCLNCGLLSTSPIPSILEIERHYSQKFQSGNYRLAFDFMEHYIHVYKDYVGMLEKYLKTYGLDLRGLRVLDIGCFTGEVLQVLHDKGADVFGIESQAEAVIIANQKLKGRVLKTHLSNTVFPDSKFHVILILGVIEHVLDPLKLIKQSFDMLEDGGILMIETPNSQSYLASLMGKFWPPCAPVEHIHLFSHKSLFYLLSELGFEKIH